MALPNDTRELVKALLTTLREDPVLLEEFRQLLVPALLIHLPDMRAIAERQEEMERHLTYDITELRHEVTELRDEVRVIAQRQQEMAQRQEEMAQRQQEMAKRQEEMAQRQEEMAQRQQEMAKRQEEMAQQQQEMAQRQEEMAQRQDGMEHRLARLETDVGHLKGDLRATIYRLNFPDFFGLWVSGVPDAWQRLWERLDNALQQNLITQDDLDELQRADIRWLGTLRRGQFVGQEVLLVVEVSWTVHREDVERALRRTTIARKAGFWAVPLVGGRQWTDEALKEWALQEGVLCAEDGRVTPLDWDGVLARWRPQ